MDSVAFIPCLVLLLLAVCCASGCDAKDAALEKKPAMADIVKEKESRTAAQKKLDSHIVLALKKSRKEPPFDKPTQLDPDLVIEPDGRVLVDLNATVTPELLAQIELHSGKVINSFEASNAIRALIPLTRLEALASRADVKFISPAAQAITNGVSGAAQGSSIKP